VTALEQRKLAAARLWGATRFPYLPSALFATRILPVRQPGVVAVDEAWRVYVDPGLLEAWTAPQMGSVLVHHVGHLLRDHAGRARALGVGREQAGRWVLAADAEINDDLAGADLEFPTEPITPQALGGEPCPCLLVRDAFRRWDAGPGGGWSGSPGSWPARRTMPGAPSAGRGGHVSAAPIGLASPGSRPSAGSARAALTLQLQSLRSDPRFQRLPAEQRDRILAHLRASVAWEIVPEPMADMLNEATQVRRSRFERRAEAPRPKPAAEERLQAAALPALEEAVRRSQRYLRPDAAIRVGCWKQSAGEARILQGDLTGRGGFVVLSLPVRWLNRVWARGLACIDGHFVLDADAPAPATELSGEAVRWERRLGGHAVPVAAPCSITRQAGRWRLAW
jgi:hypothetical protein